MISKCCSLAPHDSDPSAFYVTLEPPSNGFPAPPLQATTWNAVSLSSLWAVELRPLDSIRSTVGRSQDVPVSRGIKNEYLRYSWSWELHIGVMLVP